MNKLTGALALAATLMTAPALANHDNDTLDAAIGGGLGGAAGAAIGNEVGGRNGAILGGALGAAGGAAVTTDRYHDHYYGDHYYGNHFDRRRGRFCPPGLAKQGRC